ncbi:calcium-binding protein [Patulibacter sp. S7RM1-6]
MPTPHIPGGLPPRRGATAPRAPKLRRGAVVAATGLALALGVTGAAEAKTLIGNPGPDRLVGKSPGGDVLFGGGGADTLIGGPGNDFIYGVRSGNTINGGEGNNYIEGGPGDDKVTVGNGANTIYTGSGHDTIVAGDGNNYVDPGGAPDNVTLGNGNNVLHTGSGGGNYTVGNGNNIIFYLSGPANIKAGTGVNQIFVNSASAVQSVDCGGNPASVLYINPRTATGGISNAHAIEEGRIRNCANIIQQVGERRIKSRHAGKWDRFHLVGSDANDHLYGGHGGGEIEGKGGDNILWADSLKDTGGAKARSRTTKISAFNGDNQIYGGRGTNLITVGSGKNFIRAGQWTNRITTNGGDNVVRLQGKGRNTVTFNGGRNYVESFANGKYKPVIRCKKGAKGIVVYGRVKPKTNCGTRASAYSKKGKTLQVNGVVHIQDSDSATAGRPKPGDNGVGVPRPALATR